MYFLLLLFNHQFVSQKVIEKIEYVFKDGKLVNLKQPD